MSINEFLKEFVYQNTIVVDESFKVCLNAASVEQEFYVQVARQVFDGKLDKFAERQRLVEVLRVAIFPDGKTLPALLWIADQTFDNPDLYLGNGCNSLAGIFSYLAQQKFFTDSMQGLRAGIARIATDPSLRNNAEQIIHLLDGDEWDFNHRTWRSKGTNGSL